jgi:hypothetical protein
MAGYSGTPLPQKLGIKEGNRVAILGAPDGLHNLAPLPEGVSVRTRARGSVDVILLFVKRRAELERRIAAAGFPRPRRRAVDRVAEALLRHRD